MYDWGQAMRHTSLLVPSARRGAAAFLAQLAAAGLGVNWLPAGAYAATSSSRARAAHAINGTETTHLKLVNTEGSLLFEEGSTSGNISGHARAQLEVGAAFKGRLTIYTRNGQIIGHGTAVPHGSGRYQSFAGTFVVTGGTGRYAHAHGSSGFYGVFDRRSFAVTTQTKGWLYY
jgi:hypothetical protein